MSGTVRAMTIAALCLGADTRADVWDDQALNDDTAATANELVHRSDQVHDLAVRPGPVADEDWYRLSIKPYSSYEVVVDGASGDVGPPVQVDRVLADGTVFGSAIPIGLGFARSMRFHNPNAFVIEDKFIRVRSGGCTTTCAPSDQYRLRFYETTGAVPRFNDSGTQLTVLLLQNPTDGAITGTAYFWDAAGTLLAAPTFTLAPRSTLVMNTSTAGAGRSIGDDHHRPRRPLRGAFRQDGGPRPGHGLQLRYADRHPPLSSPRGERVRATCACRGRLVSRGSAPW